jgi:hypothetical protein
MIFRTELRRSAAPLLGLGLPVFSLVLLHSVPGPWGTGTAPWDEQWTGLAQWTRYLAVVLVPLVLAGGAWQGLRDSRSRVAELFATTPRPGWRRAAATAAALVLAVTAGYLVLLAVGGVRVAGTADHVHLKWLPVAGVMVLALGGSALLGFGLGRLVPSPVTPPVLGVAALAVQVTLLWPGWPQLLTPTLGAASTSVYSTVAVPVTLTQALWFAGIGATGFWLSVANRARTRLLAVLPAVVAAAVAVPVLSAAGDPVVPDADARALVCDENGPRVCVTRARADYLPVLAGPAREALALMRALPSPPTSVEERLADERDRPLLPGVAPVYLDPDPRTDPSRIRDAVLAGADAPECRSSLEQDAENGTRTLVARIVVAAWFTGELPVFDERQAAEAEAREEIGQAWRALRALPRDEQPARVAALRDAAVYCRGDLRTLLTTV